MMPMRAMLDNPTMFAVVRAFCTNRPGLTPIALTKVSPMMPSNA